MYATLPTAEEVLLSFQSDKITNQQFARLYLSVATTVSERVARSYRVNADDLLEPVLMGCTKLYEDMRRLRPDCIEGYIAESLRRAMIKIAKSIKKRNEKEVPLTHARSAVTMPDNSLELWEEIFICCKSDTEKRIVRLSSEGYSLKEISKLLAIPKSTVSLRLSQVESRYDARQKSYLRGDSYALAA
jgi:DNA-directed RNA polymerase specialized sigma24 family protein